MEKCTFEQGEDNLACVGKCLTKDFKSETTQCFECKAWLENSGIMRTGLKLFTSFSGDLQKLKKKKKKKKVTGAIT